MHAHMFPCNLPNLSENMWEERIYYLMQRIARSQTPPKSRTIMLLTTTLGEADLPFDRIQDVAMLQKA
jgi:hypothetical protein